MKRIISVLLLTLVALSCFASCTAAENVNHNLSQAADNFQYTVKFYGALPDVDINH